MMISPAMDAEEKISSKKKLGYLKCYIHTNHNVPLGQIKMNRSARHVSVDRQIVFNTCAKGALKYDKYQDIEAEIETTMEKWMTKIVATIVSSRAAGIRRLMEGMTMRSSEEPKTCKEQENDNVWGSGRGRPGLKHINGDVPMCMRNKENDAGMKSNEIERTRGEGGGRHRYRHVEGDVPLCMRRKVEVATGM